MFVITLFLLAWCFFLLNINKDRLYLKYLHTYIFIYYTYMFPFVVPVVRCAVGFTYFLRLFFPLLTFVSLRSLSAVSSSFYLMLLFSIFLFRNAVLPSPPLSLHFLASALFAYGSSRIPSTCAAHFFVKLSCTPHPDLTLWDPIHFNVAIAICLGIVS